MKKIFTTLFFLIAVCVTTLLAQQVEVVTETNTQKPEFENRSYLVVKSIRLTNGFRVSAATDGAFFCKMHPAAVVPTAPSPDQNFVRTETVLTPSVTTEAQVKDLTVVDKTTTFNYLDGMGRGLQANLVAGSTSLSDVIQAAYYDGAGLPSRSYLPYTNGTATPGSYRANALSDISSFYASPPTKVSQDGRSYSEITFDSSPLNRVNSIEAVGAAWDAKPAHSRIKIDQSGSIRRWTVSGGLPVSTSAYPAGILVVSETENEEQVITRSYTDSFGRTVLKETQAPQSNWARTYYVYDIAGRIAFVIPPTASSNHTPDDTYVNRWCYRHEYDHHGRLVGTKPPGAGWSYTIFDQWDRPVLSQTANQRDKSPAEWIFVKYDEFNRAVMSGIFRSYDSRTTLTTNIGNSGGRFEQRVSSSIGYTTSQSFPTSVAEADLLAITYYDDYSFTSYSGWYAGPHSFGFSPETGMNAAMSSAVIGMPTGSKVKQLDADNEWLTTNKWLRSVTYFDSRYRPIQIIVESHLGGIDRSTNDLDPFNGKLRKHLQVHINGAATLKLTKRFEYNEANGQLLRVYQKVNEEQEVITAAIEYNEIGQAIDKKIHGYDNTWLQSLDYRYNIRGWLTNINGTTPDSGDPADVVALQFGYNNSLSTGNSTRFDGLLSGVKWKNGNSSKERAYNYTYDKNALTAANYKSLNTPNLQTDVYSEHGISYDVNGNIQGLSRNAGLATATTVDVLSYNYGPSGGNQLMSVTDTQSNEAGFNDRNTSGDDYEYDSNGNLKKDKNKYIQSITYNVLDLPDRVTFNGPTNNSYYIRYRYDALGNKLSQSYYNASNQLIGEMDYVQNIVYKRPNANDARELQFIMTEEGRLVSGSSANLIANTATAEANTLEGFAANGSVTLTRESVGGQTFVKAVCNQNGGTPGVYPIGGTFTVKPNQSYSFKIDGYQSSGSNATLYVWGNNGNIIWPGATLLTTAGTDMWVSTTFTIPSGVTQIQAGILWNGGGSGNTIYINKVKLYRADWEYQYFIKDHQGSTRAVLQTTPATITITATMESENFADENTKFASLRSDRETPFANATPGGSKSLVMNSGYPIAAVKTFKVLPGDVVDASAMAYYASGGTYSKTPFTTMATALVQILTGSNPALLDGISSSYTTSASQSPNPSFTLSKEQAGKPSAFLNYILFDETYTPQEAKSQPLGSANALHPVILPTITVNEPGYLLVYLSYDNTSGQDVWFDDLKITYRESSLIQLVDYYPFGMPSLTWERDGEINNRHQYQGKEVNEQTGWQEFGSRAYYSDLGRWFAIDPQLQFASPYMAMGNIPMMGVDPNGEFWHIVIGAVVGGAVNLTIEAIEGDIESFGDGAKAFGIGALQGGLAAATMGQSTYWQVAANSALRVASSQIQPIQVSVDGLSFGVQPSFGYGDGGITAGMNAFASYDIDEHFSVGVMYGAGETESVFSYGASWRNGDWSVSYYRNAWDAGETSQTNGTISATHKEWSFHLENDWPFGDGEDRYRTAAGGVGYKGASIGFNVFTTDGNVKRAYKEGDSKKFKHHTPRWSFRKGVGGEDQGTWDDGHRIYSNLFVAYNYNGISTRVGVDAPWVQDVTQNFVHRYLTRSTPYFQTGNTPSKGYFYVGPYNPYSLYTTN